MEALDGDVKMCVAENEFKIVGVKDCFARGYQQMGFKEYDTGKQGAGWFSSPIRREPRKARANETQP